MHDRRSVRAWVDKCERTEARNRQIEKECQIMPWRNRGEIEIEIESEIER